MKKILVYILFTFLLNCFTLSFAMNSNDKTIKQDTSVNSTTQAKNVDDDEIYRKNLEEAYKYYVIDRIDGPDTPEHVKKFANENNCYHMMRHYYWSYKIFKDNGGVYSCDRNNKRQYIYDNGTKLRFARWYEKYKFRKLIYGD